MKMWAGALMLLAGLTAAAAAQPPAELLGTVGSVRQAWRLFGLPAEPTVMTHDGARGPELLIGGARVAGKVAQLGDLALVSPDGLPRRRLLFGGGVIGLPALVNQVAMAADSSGSLTFINLTAAGLQNTPRHLEETGGALVGPVTLGEVTVLVAGNSLRAITNLFEPRWQADLGGPVRTGLAVDSQRAFAATAAKLSALDLDSGQPIWARDLSSPPATDVMVAYGAVLVGLEDGSLQTYDVDSGEPLWQVAAGPRHFTPHPALAAGWLVVSTAEGLLLAYDTATGAEAWRASLPGPLSNPVVGYGRAWVTCGPGELAAVPFDKPAEPLLVKAADAAGDPLAMEGSPSLAAGRVYVGVPGGGLVAFDLQDTAGALEWPMPGGTPGRAGLSVPVEALPTLEPPPASP